MFFRIVIACLAVAAAFALYQIWTIGGPYRQIANPAASFAVLEREGNKNPLTIVEFMHYDCAYCKDSHGVLVDYARSTPEIRLVTRAVPFEGGGAQRAAELALAAGLQGKFWEMDSALSQYKAPMDEKFYRESAALYAIDYDRMTRDAEGDEVRKLAEDNIRAVYAAGVETTPAFMIGKTLYQLNAPLTLNDLIRMVREEQAK